MPFAYYGAKHGLVRRGVYPPPEHRTIVEPFAGSAAYAVAHAADVDEVILLDRDPATVAVWHELQAIDTAGLDAIEAQLERRKVTHPILGALAGNAWHTTTRGGRSTTTARMRKDWPSVRRRIEAALPHIRTWSVTCASYLDAPDIEATWFVDPPYEELTSPAGSLYRFGATRIEYFELADWCRSRRGQVIVCEQAPAAWLPFRELVEQSNGVASSTKQGRRMELVWTNDDRGS